MLKIRSLQINHNSKITQAVKHNLTTSTRRLTKLPQMKTQEISTPAPNSSDSHFFHKRGVGVGEDVPFLPSQVGARDIEVDPQVGVVAFNRHTDVLNRRKKGNVTKEEGRFQSAAILLLISSSRWAWPRLYLDGGNVERRGDAKDGHDDRLVLLVDEDLHFSDLSFSGHLRDVLVGYVRFPRPEKEKSRP